MLSYAQQPRIAPSRYFDSNMGQTNIQMTLKPHWESQDKRWNVEAYAANLLKRNVEDLIGVNLIVRF